MLLTVMQTKDVVSLVSVILLVGTRSEEEEEGSLHKLLPANKADNLCQSWQSCPTYEHVWKRQRALNPPLQRVAASQQSRRVRNGNIPL